MNTYEMSLTIRSRMRSDMLNTLRQHLGPTAIITGEMVGQLVEDGMFPVEHLIAQMDNEAGGGSWTL